MAHFYFPSMSAKTFCAQCRRQEAHAFNSYLTVRASWDYSNIEIMRRFSQISQIRKLLILLYLFLGIGVVESKKVLATRLPQVVGVSEVVAFSPISNQNSEATFWALRTLKGTDFAAFSLCGAAPCFPVHKGQSDSQDSLIKHSKTFLKLSSSSHCKPQAAKYVAK